MSGSTDDCSFNAARVAAVLARVRRRVVGVEITAMLEVDAEAEVEA